MRGLLSYFFAALLLSTPATAQHPMSPHVDYILTVDSTDLSGYSVRMQVHHVPHVFTLALATHHEYDDRFWRFVQDFKVSSPRGNAQFKRKDSAVWQVSIAGNTATIDYRIKLPRILSHFSHRPFLSATGGLVGDIHSFMYLPDYLHGAATVTFCLPRSWRIATGLNPTKDSHVFTAPSPAVLLDCPVLIGQLRTWHFTVHHIIHTVAYLPGADPSHFDAVGILKNIKKIVTEAVKICKGIPYHRYFFLLEDGQIGALEYHNSVTLGAPSSMLSSHPAELYEELAHEFFHAWNLIYIKPAEYTALNYGPQQTSAGLWFSEGFTMFYADLIARRAGLPMADTADLTRIAHLESLIQRYYTDTGNRVIPPGKVSLSSNELPGNLGDYTASVHLQGELLAAMLDLLIRDASDGHKDLDDVMKLVYQRFGGTRGFYAKDIELASTQICGCHTEVTRLFSNTFYKGQPIDFNRYLHLAGLQYHLSYSPAKDNTGELIPDRRVFVWQPPGDSLFHIGMTNPNNCWTNAGIHTGDVIVALNGHLIADRQQFYTIVNSLHIGDTVWVTTKQAKGALKIPVTLARYEVPFVNIVAIKESSPRQLKLLQQWQKGN